MSDLSRILGLDKNPGALNLLNGVGQSLAISAGQTALNKGQVPINLAQFAPSVPVEDALPSAVRLDPTIQHNGLKTVFHALVEGVSADGLTVGQYIAAVEARLDGWVDSIG